MSEPEHPDSPTSGLEARTWTIDELLKLARAGTLAVPRFQRNFEWKANDVVHLFDSIYKGYPIGNLLIWTTAVDQQQLQYRLGSFEPASRRSNPHLLIDGQQRVTSIVATFLRDKDMDHELSTFNVGFDLAKRAFSTEAGQGPWLPLNRAADTYGFLRWLQSQDPPLDRDQTEVANKVVSALRDYKIPAYVLVTDDEKTAREAFARLNRSGRPLKEVDVFQALQKGRADGADLVVLQHKLADRAWGVIDVEWIYKALAAVEGKTETELRQPDVTLRAIGDSCVAALNRTVDFLRAAGVPHWTLLPYRFPLLALVRFFNKHPEPSDEVRDILSRWLWCGAASGDHSRSSKPALVDAFKAAADADPQTAARRLNAQVRQAVEPLRLDKPHDFRKALTKLACIALTTREPRHLQTGDLLDYGALVAEADDAHALWPSLTPTPKKGTHNRLLHPKAERIRELVVEASTEVLASHLIDEEARVLLAEGQWDHFLERRRDRLEACLHDFLAEKGVGFENTPSHVGPVPPAAAE